jgi:hypothetical protein
MKRVAVFDRRLAELFAEAALKEPEGSFRREFYEKEAEGYKARAAEREAYRESLDA